MTHPDPIEATLAVSIDGQPDEQQLRRARWATRAQFAALGVLSGAWGVHIPSVKSTYALSEATLSLVLLAAASGAVASLFFAGRIVGWLGARGAAMCSAAVMGSMLALALHWPSLTWLLPSMLLFGAAMSLFDVAINTEGSALEAMAGRPVMSNLHGSFSVGGMAGAVLTAFLIRANWPPAGQLLVIGGAVALWVLWSARGMLRTHPQSEQDEPQALFAWPRGTLLVLGLLIFAGMSAEGTMYDWCVLYLKQEVGMPQSQAAWGYAAFSAAMAVARFGGDALRMRHGERQLLRAGGGMTALAMALVLLARDPWVSLAGFAIVGAGLALVVPILYNAATRVPGTTRAAAIASVSSIGYSGFMVGPPLIGGLAQTTSLSWALSVVVVAALVLAWGARYVPGPQRRSCPARLRP